MENQINSSVEYTIKNTFNDNIDVKILKLNQQIDKLNKQIIKQNEIIEYLKQQNSQLKRNMYNF